MSKITIEEAKDIIIKNFEYNKILLENGFKQNAICFTGDSGIGKTSIVAQAVEDLSNKLSKKINLVKRNLAELSDSSDLIGYPKVKTLIKKGDISKWIFDNNLNQYPDWEKTESSITTYAEPDWVEELQEGGILCLDDYSRAAPRLLQAVMELIDSGKYHSWSLPKDVLIVLTGNPAGEDYLVAEEDRAQKTRYIEYEVEFNYESWRNWATTKNIKEKYIEFIKLHGDQVLTKQNQANIRQWTKVFALLSVAEVDDMFLNSFIEAAVGNANKLVFLDYLSKLHNLEFDAKDYFTSKNLDKQLKQLKNILYEGDYYKHSVASVVLERIINYMIKDHFANPDGTEALVSKFSKLFSQNVLNIQNLPTVQELAESIAPPNSDLSVFISKLWLNDEIMELLDKIDE